MILMTHTRGTTVKVPASGREFLAAVDTAIAAIRRHPTAYQLVDPTMRRALLRRFPYGIFFEVAGTEIIVYAVSHGARDPRSWRRRRRHA